MENTDLEPWNLMALDSEENPVLHIDDGYVHVHVMSHRFTVQVLRDAKRFSIAYGTSMRPLEGGILFHADAPWHGQHRRMLLPVFNPANVHPNHY
jgi:hypothetical protein